MRNALVLVPLCIGLISGFIVSTTTTEVNENVQIFPTKPLVNMSIDQAELINSVESTAVPVYNINEDDKELYSQGTEDKNINERSLVLVNQGWKKFPYLDDAKKSSTFISYEDAIKSFQKKLIVKQQKVKENNENVPPMAESNIDYRIKNKESDMQTNYVKNMKSLLLTNSNNDRQLIQNESLEYVRKNYVPIYNNIKNGNNKYFKDFDKETNNFKVYIKKGEKLGEGSENDPLTKEMIFDLQDSFNNESIGAHKLFQLTSEEQAPEKESLQNNNKNNLNDFKCCRQCKANRRKLNGDTDMECKCKCGKYIRLRRPADVGNKRVKAFLKLPKVIKKILVK